VKFFILSSIFLFSFSSLPVLGQVGITENTGRSSTKSTLTYKITSTFTTQSSIEGTNVTGTADATVILAPGGFITNKIGDDNGNASATFNASPNGSSVNLQGVTGENLFLLEGGSTFTSNIETVENPDPSLPVRGSASATAIQTTIVDVNYGEESFQSSYQQNF
jgi:hypothetical protein